MVAVNLGNMESKRTAFGTVVGKRWLSSLAALASISRTLRLVWDAHPSLTILLAGTTILQGLIPATSAWVGKLVVDGVVQAIANPAGRVAQLTALVVLAFTIALAGQILNSLAQVSQDILRDLLGQRINTMIIEKATTLDLSYYETPAFYNMLQRAQQEANYRPLSMLNQTFALIRGTITIISLIALLLRFSPWLVLVLVVTGLPALFVQSAYGRAAFRMYSGRTPAWRELMYLSSLLTAKRSIKEIKLFGLAPTLTGRYKELYARFYRENRSLSIKRNLGNIAMQLVSLLGYYGAYFAVILQTVSSRITLGDLTMYSNVLMQAQATANTLMFSLADLYEQNLFINNLFAFLELQPRIQPGGNGRPAPESFRSGIEMRNVTFRYPGTGKPVLNNINLKIRPGEKLALVGENGAGKTTLIKLLTRLYDPDEGVITLDGIDLREIDLDSLHARMGVIFQDFVRYHLSGHENIGFGQIGTLGNEEYIQAAAKKSGAHEVLSNLPKGYDTILGRWFDDEGMDISVGEWQKVALARAYIRDAPILILDEPTASLDAKAEYEIFKHFKDLTIDRTAILISHRFSTVRMADRILVLKDGQIVEQGSHDELITVNGLYATMFNLQAKGYRQEIEEGA